MKASGIIYTNAEVVEADRIDDSDAGAVPAHSTISTDRRYEGYRAQLAFIFETNLLLRELFCAFDGVEIGSTGCSKRTSRPKAKKLNANDNFAPEAFALAA